MEAPDLDALAGVTCSVKGCDAVFSTTDLATHGAYTTNCGHSLCGTCADAFVRDADLLPMCPLCCEANLTLRPNPGLSEHGDALRAIVKGIHAVTVREPGEEHKCATCDAEGNSVVATHQCAGCNKFFCDDDAPVHARNFTHVANSLKPVVVEPSLIRLQEPNCGRHGFPLDMFCATCCKALCAKCALADHQGHNLIDEFGLARKVRAFSQVALEQASYVDANGAYVAAARVSLAGFRQRVVAAVTASKTAAVKAVTDHFDHLLAIVNTEADERDKALASQERECTVVAAQLRAGGGVCDNALAAASNIALASALHTAELMKPMLKPFIGLAAATDMDMVLDLAPLTTALVGVGQFVQFPVDPATVRLK